MSSALPWHTLSTWWVGRGIPPEWAAAVLTSGGEERGRAVEKDNPLPQTVLLPHAVHGIPGTLRARTAAPQRRVSCLKEKQPGGVVGPGVP